MSKFGKDLITSLRQAVKLAKGKRVTGTRVTVVNALSVRDARKSETAEQVKTGKALMRRYRKALSALAK